MISILINAEVFRISIYFTANSIFFIALGFEKMYLSTSPAIPSEGWNLCINLMQTHSCKKKGILGAAAILSLFDDGLRFPKANCNLDLGYSMP